MTDAQEIKKTLWEKMADSPFLMVGLTGPDQAHSEPLTAQLDENQTDTIFFFTSRDNRVAKGGAAMAQFVSKGHDFFACLSGSIREHDDPRMIDRLWNKQVEAWFAGGRDDPALMLIRFDIDDAELWGTDMSLSGKLKMLFGGTIRAGEAGSHAKVETTAY